MAQLLAQFPYIVSLILGFGAGFMVIFPIHIFCMYRAEREIKNLKEQVRRFEKSTGILIDSIKKALPDSKEPEPTEWTKSMLQDIKKQ